jgi:drug/metabolite transporter (DMT)-like permease
MNVPMTTIPASGAPYGPDVNNWTLLAAVALLVPVCFWVYNDARMRYNTRGAPLLWAALVFLALIVFLPLYLMVRPPRRPPPGPGAPPDNDR